MSNLLILQHKSQLEISRVLFLASSTLLPEAGIGKRTEFDVNNISVAQAVLSEIRDRCGLREGDMSAAALSKIYSVLSEEISLVVLEGVDLNKIKTRLGNKGDLHPSQYKIVFGQQIEMIEALGVTKSHLESVIRHPNASIDLAPQSLNEERDPRVSVKVKFINAKRTENNYALFVITQRAGEFQVVVGAFRVYVADVPLKNVSEPMDVVRAFVAKYGVPFRLGTVVSSFIEREVINLHQPLEAAAKIDVLHPKSGKIYWPLFAGDLTRFTDPQGGVLGEVLLSFVVDVSEYIQTLHKHNVSLPADPEKFFKHRPHKVS